MHFTWSDLLFFLPKGSYHITYGLLVGLIVLTLGFFARKALDKKQGDLPEDTWSILGFFEAFVDGINRLALSVIGPESKPMLPAFCFIFLFIWLQNLLGLIPGFLPATGNVNTTVALGLFSFIMYNYWGFKAHGISYLKQFLGPVLFMAPLFIFIEIVSHIFRALSLGLRLFGNMKGDHMVIGIFLEMAPYFVPIIFYFLGFFVCTLQAFVFTILSMVYVSLACSTDH